MISPSNQTKNNVTPTGNAKAGVALWGDVLFTWGDIVATWGGNIISPSNQIKSPMGSITIYQGQPMGLLMSITYPTTFSIGSGVFNQPKS